MKNERVRVTRDYHSPFFLNRCIFFPAHKENTAKKLAEISYAINH